MSSLSCVSCNQLCAVMKLKALSCNHCLCYECLATIIKVDDHLSIISVQCPFCSTLTHKTFSKQLIEKVTKKSFSDKIGLSTTIIALIDVIIVYSMLYGLIWGFDSGYSYSIHKSIRSLTLSDYVFPILLLIFMIQEQFFIDLNLNTITDRSIIILDLVMIVMLSIGTMLPVDYSYIHSMDKYILMSLYQNFIPVTALFLAINSLIAFIHDHDPDSSSSSSNSWTVRHRHNSDSNAAGGDAAIVTPTEKVDGSIKVVDGDNNSNKSPSTAAWTTTLQYIAQFCSPPQRSPSTPISNQPSFDSPNIFDDVSESELYRVKASPISNTSSPHVFNNNYVSGDLFTPVPNNKLSDAMSSLYNRMVVSPLLSPPHPPLITTTTTTIINADKMNTEVQYDHYVNLFQDGANIAMVNPMRRSLMDDNKGNVSLSVSFAEVDNGQQEEEDDDNMYPLDSLKTPTKDKEMMMQQQQQVLTPSSQRSGVEIMKAASKLSAPSSAIRLLYNKLRHSSKKTKQQQGGHHQSLNNSYNYASAAVTTTTSTSTPIPEVTATIVPISSAKDRQQQQQGGGGGLMDDSKLNTSAVTRDEDKSTMGATAISRLNLSITAENRLIFIVPINWRMATGKSLDSISRCLTIMISQCSKKQCPFAIGLFACCSSHHHHHHLNNTSSSSSSLAKNGVLRYMHATGANSSMRADIHWLYVSGKVSTSSSSSSMIGKGKDRSSYTSSKQYYDVHLYNKPLWFHPSYSNALLSDAMSFNPTTFVNARNVFDKSSSLSNDISMATIHGSSSSASSSSSSFSSSTIMPKINVHSTDINQLITKMLSQNQHLTTPNTEVTDVSSGGRNLKYLTNYYLSSNSKEIESCLKAFPCFTDVVLICDGAAWPFVEISDGSDHTQLDDLSAVTENYMQNWIDFRECFKDNKFHFISIQTII